MRLCERGRNPRHVARLADVRRYAFTLAEVLVTLGIIGVVSAMTVPSLMQNYQRQSYVTQLHKVYNIISQAMMQYQNDRNAVNLLEAGLNSQDAVNDFMTSYFKIVNSCLEEAIKPCFSDNYKKMSGGTYNAFGSAKGSFIIAGGATLRPYYYYKVEKGNEMLVWLIDINTQKGPNIVGRDLFVICSDINGLMDECIFEKDKTYPLTSDEREKLYQENCISDANVAGGCFGKILNDNWEMNY